VVRLACKVRNTALDLSTTATKTRASATGIAFMKMRLAHGWSEFGHRCRHSILA
jgi:hypothetical protein